MTEESKGEARAGGAPALYRVSAFAKLNLRLKVEGRRDDGYHLLSMINVVTDLRDELTVGFFKEPVIELAVENGPTDIIPAGAAHQVLFGIGRNRAGRDDVGRPEKNLVSRAAREFMRVCGISLGARIALKKNIPVGGGLGGGSSDAAAMLSFLAEVLGQAVMTDHEWTPDDLEHALAEIAVGLGADVPYLLYGGFAHVAGIGDQISPLPGVLIDKVPALLVLPPVSVDTAEVFARFRTAHPDLAATPDAAGRAFGNDMSLALASELDDAPWTEKVKVPMYSQLLSLIENDLEPSVRRSCPPVAAVLDAVRAGGEHFAVGLTGSGSTIFALPRRADSFETKFYEDLCATLRTQNVRTHRVELCAAPVLGGVGRPQ